jgi:hypothetical protein
MLVLLLRLRRIRYTGYDNLAAYGSPYECLTTACGAAYLLSERDSGQAL